MFSQKRLVSVLIIVITIMASFAVVQNVQAAYSGTFGIFGFRRQITLNNSAQSTALSNFPAAVQLKSGADKINFDYSHTQDNGQDIRFVDADNITLLDYEIERWDETATSTVWVKVPNIAAASSTDFIFMYYGNPDVSDNSTTTGVWDDNYIIVNHMNASGTNTRQDSTKYDHDAVPQDYEGTESTLGVAGNADDLDASDYSLITDHADFDANNLTVEAWVNLDTYGGNGIGHQFNSDAFAMYVEGTATGLYFAACRWDGDDGEWFRSGSIGTGAWKHLAVLYTYDSGSPENPPDAMYANGVTGSISTYTTPTGSLVGNGTNILVGCRVAGGVKCMDGRLDEIRVSKVQRTGDWIKFTYCNIIQTCTSYGAEETSNSTPTISSATDTPDPTNPNRSVTFIINWSDLDFSESVKLKICQTNSLTNQVCDGGFWASSTTFTTDNPASVKYNVVAGDHGQTRDYWAFVCDDAASCSSSSSGTFSVNAQSTVPNIKVRGGLKIR